jgi:phosphatidylethanolamine/phosphatidyl-N-methylethanolamine N-methyltransferase
MNPSEPAPSAPPPSDIWVFAREFARAPIRTGAIAPSSRRLAAAVVSAVPESGDPTVVELGPGTGAFTDEIQRRLDGRGQHLAIELNPQLATLLTRRFPAVSVVSGNAADLSRILLRRGISGVDVVVSGLPWAVFPCVAQRAILGAVATNLTPNGAFTTFAYIHARPTRPATRFRRLLGQRFEEVVEGRTIWGNLPPAFVYHARRPRSGADRSPAS